jgi:hypothetical protein
MNNKQHKEWLEERAAIREYDGLQSRKEAEKAALDDFTRYYNDKTTTKTGI